MSQPNAHTKQKKTKIAKEAVVLFCFTLIYLSQKQNACKCTKKSMMSNNLFLTNHAEML